MSTSNPFTFPGLWPYIEVAAEGRGLPFLGRGKELWHYKQVQDSLGQLPGLGAEARRESLSHVASVRDSLAATLDGIDLAVRESLRAIDDQVESPGGVDTPAEPAEPTARRVTGTRRRQG